MIIKKFTGKTEEDALEAARKELGSGIVTMNVKSVKKKGIAGFFGAKQVEVTVALEEEDESIRNVRKEVPASAASVTGSVNATVAQPRETVSLISENSSPFSSFRLKTTLL